MRHDLITETMKRVTARGFDPRRSPWDHKVCVLLHAAQGIIDNGGFEYFFESSFHGNPDMEDFPRVFEAVGASSTAGAILEALQRSRIAGANYDDLNKLLWRESEQNYQLLEAYITAHAESYA